VLIKLNFLPRYEIDFIEPKGTIKVYEPSVSMDIEGFNYILTGGEKLHAK
jgi:hypothetical protein